MSLTLPASPPASFTPAAAAAHLPPFADAINNNPCGKQTVASVGGVSVQSRNLCLGHLRMADGFVAGAIVLGT